MHLLICKQTKELISIGSPIVFLRAVIDGRPSLHLQVGDPRLLEVVGSTDVVELSQEVEHIVIAGVRGFVELSEARVSFFWVGDGLSASVKSFVSKVVELDIALTPFLESEGAKFKEVGMDQSSLRRDFDSLLRALSDLEGVLGQPDLQFYR